MLLPSLSVLALTLARDLILPFAKNIRFSAALLVVSLMIVLPTVAFADAEPLPTTPAETLAAPVSPSVPAAAPVVWSRLAYKMLFISTYGPIPTCKQETPPLSCYPPLSNVRVKIYDSQKKLFKSVVTNDKGRVLISFPEKRARYTMTVSHAPINGKRLQTRTDPLRLPFLGVNGVSEWRMSYCLSTTFAC